jgi:hypothetical protein
MRTGLRFIGGNAHVGFLLSLACASAVNGALAARIGLSDLLNAEYNDDRPDCTILLY